MCWGMPTQQSFFKPSHTSAGFFLPSSMPHTNFFLLYVAAFFNALFRVIEVSIFRPAISKFSRPLAVVFFWTGVDFGPSAVLDRCG